MRRGAVFTILFGVLVIGYLVWPVYAVTALARAVETRDVPAVMHSVHITAVRQSLAQQIIETYLKLTGRLGSPLLRGAVVHATESIVDPMLADLTTSDAVAEMLRTGWPTGVLKERPPGLHGLTAANLGSAWQVYRTAQYGFRRFELALPPSEAYDRRIQFEFQIVKWRWQLVKVRLPEYIRVQLAQLLIKSHPIP